MKIDKAIETLQFHYEWVKPLKDPDVTEATRLGIEALKFIDYCRSGTYDPPFDLLPGETEE